eukprot:scaffold48356_cov63-Phaeocystis_antarctica.AAC.6
MYTQTYNVHADQTDIYLAQDHSCATCTHAMLIPCTHTTFLSLHIPSPAVTLLQHETRRVAHHTSSSRFIQPAAPAGPSAPNPPRPPRPPCPQRASPPQWGLDITDTGLTAALDDGEGAASGLEGADESDARSKSGSRMRAMMECMGLDGVHGLGTGSLLLSVTPVAGEVSWASSHSAMALRSPSANFACIGRRGGGSRRGGSAIAAHSSSSSQTTSSRALNAASSSSAWPACTSATSTVSAARAARAACVARAARATRAARAAALYMLKACAAAAGSGLEQSQSTACSHSERSASAASSLAAASAASCFAAAAAASSLA